MKKKVTHTTLMRELRAEIYRLSARISDLKSAWFVSTNRINYLYGKLQGFKETLEVLEHIRDNQDG